MIASVSCPRSIRKHQGESVTAICCTVDASFTRKKPGAIYFPSEKSSGIAASFFFLVESLGRKKMKKVLLDEASRWYFRGDRVVLEAHEHRRDMIVGCSIRRAFGPYEKVAHLDRVRRVVSRQPSEIAPRQWPVSSVSGRVARVRCCKQKPRRFRYTQRQRGRFYCCA